MKCDVCGSENLEGAAYCEDCGGKLVIVAQAAAAAPAPAAAAPAAPAVAPTPVAAAPAAGGTQQCASCGAFNAESESYCVDCGANLRPVAAPATPVPAVVPVTPQVMSPPPAAAAAAAPAAGAFLVLLSSGKQYPLTQDITTMGRRSLADQIEPDVDLTDYDPDAYVSRRHAKITRCDSGFLFEDVGSSNGSTINGGARLAPGVQHLLKANDRITLGRTEFEFRG